MEIVPELYLPKYQLQSEYSNLLVVNKNTQTPKILCIIEADESSKANLREDFGHFALKTTENGELALVLTKSLESELTVTYQLLVTAISEQVVSSYKRNHKINSV